jgi:hypothetical protein
VSSDEGIDALEDAFQRTPRCAVHPEREARRAPCERCGNYACEPCFERPDDALCAACRERVGDGVAWEREDLGGPSTRLWETVKQMLPAPYTTFERLGEGDGLPSALYFAFLVNLASYGAPFVLCAPCILLAIGTINPDDPDTSRTAIVLATCVITFAIPLVVAAFSVVGSFLQSLVYHAAALVAGGTASFASSLRACLYLQVTAPIAAVVWLLGRIPLFGFVLTLLWYTASLVWQTFALAGHAKGMHRIDSQRAWLVAAVPAIVLVVAFLGLFVLFFGLIFALLAGDPSFLEDID